MTERLCSLLIEIKTSKCTQWHLIFHSPSMIYLKDDPYLKCCLMYSPFLLSPIRRWFLDMIVEVSDARILKFLESRLQAGDISVVEALETLLLSINHLQPIPELVEMAKVSKC